MIHTMRRTLALAALGIILRPHAAAQLDAAAASKGKCPVNYSACPGLGEPYLMCCPSASICIGLAANTTKLCCRPDQNGCVDIGPVTCDISQQNATLYPETLLSTSLLEGEMNLPNCLDRNGNSACCPFGFLCDPTNNNRCRKQVDQLNWRSESALVPSPSQTSQTSQPPSSSATETSSSTTSAAPSATETDAELPALPATTSDTPSKFPIPAVLVGFFPGLAVGIFLALSILCFLGARRRNRTRPPISSPTFQGSEFGGRSDFIRNYQPSQEGTPRTSEVPQKGIARVKTMIRKSMNANNAYRGLGIGLPANPAPQPPLPPLQPAPLGIRRASRQQERESQMERQPSEVSISVFADPHVRAAGAGQAVGYPMSERQTHMSSYSVDRQSRWDQRPMTSQTNFTDMFESQMSDVKKNGYVPRELVDDAGGERLSPKRFEGGSSPRRLA